ncbi:MAG TPA: anhydro-N-acetylmuramic acid kinase [Parafilimonas sp.]|nr:anhydro-N-acetylmuramic acid kinase [Parafilimonas sp.]
MVYNVIGLMSGSSLDGLDIIFTELEEARGVWNYNIKACNCYEYDVEWKTNLFNAKNLDAYSYMLLHINYGKFLAGKINRFINENNLYHQVQLIASHGHTVFHAPGLNMTSQLGDGATIAALTGINVVSDLRNMDVALNGQGAPIVPLGEKLLFPGYDFYLNIGGIANLSFQTKNNVIAFDVCAANSILNKLAATNEKEYDEDGKIAATGSINTTLLNELNALDYYIQSFPKSLSNDFGLNIIYPLVQSYKINVSDALRTYVEHIALQVFNSVKNLLNNELSQNLHSLKLLITGGGAFNKFLVEVLKEKLAALNIDILMPEIEVIKYKEALIMALLGVLRWREENTVLASVTGALRSSIGGAVWIGQEA